LDAGNFLNKLNIAKEIKEIIQKNKKITIPKNQDDLFNICTTSAKNGYFDVSYEVHGKEKVTEARVCKVRNGISANYMEPYMRRRDPDCLLIGDNLPTDKIRYKDVYNREFNQLRTETFNWLENQELLVFPFISGPNDIGIPSLAIIPANASFFAFGLSLLQGITNIDLLTEPYDPKCLLFVAPVFRHTHFNGKQVVVHNRHDDIHEIFSYNLYPGPSAKKGIYGALINFGEKEGWVTLHAAGVQVVTPYDNKINILHEGASGGGKSEINEHFHREFDGSILFAQHINTDEKRYIIIPKGCDLKPVCDDMAVCHPSLQKNNGKLAVIDAEDSWFIRVDHIINYGTDPDIEARSIHPQKPLLFLNIDAPPSGTALLWEHIEDEPGKLCPNPRFILPREIVPDVINKAINIDIRSFGVRTPPCTKKKPSYGIIGLFHILPSSLAWLWRLVSPRGFDNPSIISKEKMGSEGVGSYWPFATGRKIDQANLLLKQIISTPKVHYTLCPIKHIGAWKVNFMPQWIMREYLARRGGVRFEKHELAPSRCSLLGYSINKLTVEGQSFDTSFLKIEKQAEVGMEAYDIGASMLNDFFIEELKPYMTDELDKKGREIIDCLLSNGKLDDYENLIEAESIFIDD